MPLTVITPPTDAIAPIVMEQAKEFARVSFNDDDLTIEQLIMAAREHVEQVTGRQLMPATYMLTQRAFTECVTRLPRTPLIEVTSLKYRDRDGTLQTLTANIDYLVDTAAEPGTVEPIVSWPTTGVYPDAVQITFRAGYDDEGLIPERASLAILALVAHWYDNRQPIAEAGWHPAPYHVQRLLAGLRVWS
jgi:uncharacterized phiE125 gp8 family phage protein